MSWKQTLIQAMCVVVFILIVASLSYLHHILTHPKETQAGIENIETDKYNELLEKYNELKKQFTQEVTVTAYTPCKYETDSTPDETTLMMKSRPGWHVAVSRDLKWMLGKKVYIEGVGIRKVVDLMNSRYRNRIDIMVPNKQMARNIGKRKNVDVLVYKK